MPPLELNKIPLLAILGQTAAGKSQLAIQIAQKINGEIISCDSMQIYRQMDIGTAKASQEERDIIPHHFIDILDIHESYDASLFVNKAKETIIDITSRNKIPILAGGTGLYAKLLLYGGDMLPADKNIHQALIEEYNQKGHDVLLNELKTKDPESAQKTLNKRRLLRMLEAIRISGRPITGSEYSEKPIYNSLEYILNCTPEYSRNLIPKRTEEMFKKGWIAETANLIQKGLSESPTASQAIGYRQITDFLNGQFSSEEEVMAKVKTATLRYAKRQRTWFRHQHAFAKILEFTEKPNFEKITDNIISDFKAIN